jgi:AraC-like DNA-binding protein
MSLSISLSSARVVAVIVSVLLMLQFVALGLRVIQDSLFVIWHRHERRIVESMKMSQTDIVHSSSKTNELYGDIYARLVALFEADKPYLDSELTINDVVKKIFTNKLYISRAISRFTGRNFCQFVNYYRVSYSIKLFRDNPDLKVAELANQSGFNSTVSFSMAFRLYMTECPSDWCRKERSKIVRGKK